MKTILTGRYETDINLDKRRIEFKYTFSNRHQVVFYTTFEYLCNSTEEELLKAFTSRIEDEDKTNESIKNNLTSE